MSESNEQAEETIDLDIFADLWKTDDDAADTGDEDGEKPEGEEEDKSSEGSNETPTPPQTLVITPEMRAQIAREEAQKVMTRLTAEKQEQEIEELLRNGSDEDVAKHFREREAAARNEGALAEYTKAEVNKYADQILTAQLTPDFIESLTEEEATKLDPRTWQGSDADYIATILDIKASHARNGLYDDAEVERRVQERLKANGNVARGERLRSASPTSVPTSEPSENDFEGLSHYESRDKQFAAIEAELFKT